MTNDGKYIQRSLGMIFEENKEDNKEGTRKIEGLAAVYDKVCEIKGFWGGFREKIAPGAFDNADMSDVAFYMNHDVSKIPMARCRKSRDKNSLQVWSDVDGLRMRTELDVENNADSKTLCSAIDRGDVDQMSFCFIVDSEEWSDMDSALPLRTITGIKKVCEVSAVTYPAYDDTEIGFARAKKSLESDQAALESAKRAQQERDKEKFVNLEIVKKKILMM